MAFDSTRAAIEYEAETAGALGENTSTFATHQLRVIGKVDMSGLSHPSIEPDRLVGQLQGGTTAIKSTMGGSFKTKFYLAGHGATTTGATTIDALETFFGFAFGYATVVAASGTTATGAGTVTAPTTTASGTIAAGAVIPIGLGPVGATAADGRGGGQFYAVSTHATTTLNLYNALPATLSNNDPIGSATNLYFPESPSDSKCDITGWRGRILTSTLNYEVHGCHILGIAITGLNPGEIPMIEFTWGVAWWKSTASGSLPSSVTANTYNPSPVASGSFFINDVGTSTYTLGTSVLKIRSFGVNLGMSTAVLKAPGGAMQYQDIQAARRTPTKISLNFTVDADSAATATPALDTKWLNGTAQHVLYTLNTAAGARVALYFRNACPTGARPVPRDQNGVWAMPLELNAYAGSTTTTPLSQSAMVVALA